MEIEKDLRLPYGYQSWLQLAKYVMSQDELHRGFRNVDGTFKQQIILAAESPINQSLTAGVEHFEIDTNTLKIRAFDELKDFIPDVDSLIRLKYELRQSSAAIINFYDTDQKPHQSSLASFIDKLIELLGQ